MVRVLPLAAMERILKNCGAKRVSDKAKITLRDILEAEAEKIGRKAVKLALHAGRKTVKDKDIKLASQD